MKEKLIICPVCKGTCYADSEARRIRVGMNWWIEKQCTCCRGDGRTTRSAWLQWQANKQQTVRPVYLVEGER